MTEGNFRNWNRDNSEVIIMMIIRINTDQELVSGSALGFVHVVYPLMVSTSLLGRYPILYNKRLGY